MTALKVHPLLAGYPLDIRLTGMGRLFINLKTPIKNPHPDRRRNHWAFAPELPAGEYTVIAFLRTGSFSLARNGHTAYIGYTERDLVEALLAALETGEAETREESIRDLVADDGHLIVDFFEALVKGGAATIDDIRDAVDAVMNRAD